MMLYDETMNVILYLYFQDNLLHENGESGIDGNVHDLRGF